MKRIISLATILSLNFSTAYAGVGKELKGINKELGNVWNALGTETVTNSARYYQGQQRGHYTMGSMYFARQKKNRPLVSVNFPEIDLDKSCYSQGVLNFGGFSFISGDELKNKVQGIVQQAGLMFVYLGLSSLSPTIGEAAQEVLSKLQEVGGFLADECQAAKQIVGFMGDKLSQHSAVAKDIFSKMETGSGSKKDLSTAYKDFPKGKNEALKNAAKKNEKLIVQDINIAWKALEKLTGSNDKELKELMMTISGTIIIKAPKNDNDSPNYQYISSTVTNPGLLEALLKGNKSMKVLKCKEGESKCLNVTEIDKHIDREKSFEHKVSEYFDKFKEAIQEDKELEENARIFLAKAGAAAFKNYDVMFQYTNGSPEFEQGLLVEIVAWNILNNYLSDILKEVNEAANNLQLGANEELKEFRNSIKAAQELLDNFEMKDLTRYKLQLNLVNRSEKMEETMADETAQILSMARNS